MGRSRGMVLNLRRLGAHHPRHQHRCPVCRERHERLGTRPGADAIGSLADEQHQTGVGSWACMAELYGLGRPGAWRCVCGGEVSTPCALCLECSVSMAGLEDEVFVLRKGYVEECTG